MNFKYLIPILIVIFILIIGIFYYESNINKPKPSIKPTIQAPAQEVATPIQHIVVIEFENQPLNNVLSEGPYFNYLYNNYGKATNYYAACHPSAPNYLAKTSGNTWQCGSDSLNLYTTTNLGTLLENKNISQGGNLTWYAFMESMPSPCHRKNSGKYVFRHNPFVYYADLVNSNLCVEHDVPLDVWTNLVKADNIPNFSYISPNVLNDGHDTNVTYADNWLRSFLSPLLTTSWANDTVFFITFDESVLFDKSGFNGFKGGHTYMVAVSPYSKGLSVTTNTTDYNLLTTIEWLLNLGTSGNNDDPSKYPPMKELFNFTEVN